MKLIDRYIEIAALKSFLLIASALTALFSLLEFVDQLHDVGQGQYRVLDAFFYVLLTAPSRLLQLMPASMLLGSLFALGRLSNDSELIAMQAVGVAPRQVTLWVMKLAVPIVLALFLVAEFVIPTAQRLAQTERLSKMSVSAAIENGNGFWAQEDHQYLYVGWADYGDTLRDIDIYMFDKDGELKSFIHAATATIAADDLWRLSGVTRTALDASGAQTEKLASLPWHSFVRPGQVRLLTLPPDSMPPIELYRYIRGLERSHQQAPRLEQAFWAKIGIPLSMAAMVLISTPFVFGPPRARSAGQRIAIGAGIGIVFTLFQQVTNLLGLLLDVNPLVPAMVPSLLLLVATRYLFRRTAALS